MNINKILRRNTKPLLMVFMSLLLVAFLIPNTLQGCGQRAQQIDFERGMAFGKKITQAQLENVRGEIAVLQRFGLRPFVGGEDPALHYYLQCLEAEQLGLHVGKAEVVDLLKKGGVTDEVVRRVAASGFGYDQIYEIIGKYLAVSRLNEVQSSAMFFSLPRQEMAFRDNSQKARADVSVVSSEAFVHLVPEPTAEQLQTFFEECKDRFTLHTDEELSFGCKYPDRVMVEYLTVDPMDLEDDIIVREDDVREYYEDNKTRYVMYPPSSPGQRPEPIQKTFEQAEPDARRDLRTERARDAAQAIVNEMALEAEAAWGAEAPLDDGFAPGLDIISFEELKAKFTTPEREVVHYRSEELQDENTIRMLAGFGQARLPSITAPELALQVKGILERAPERGSMTAINVNEPAPVVLTWDYATRKPKQAFLFRVTGVAPAAPPASIDEVREELVENWKLVQAHEMARKAAEELSTKAREAGLVAAVEAAADLKTTLVAGETAIAEGPDAPAIRPTFSTDLTPTQPANLTRAGVYLKGGTHTALAEALFEMVDEPAAEGTHRVSVLPWARNLKWVIGELHEVDPVYEGPFTRQVGQNVRTMSGDPRFVSSFGSVWAMPENLQARTGFEAPKLESAEGEELPAEE